MRTQSKSIEILLVSSLCLIFSNHLKCQEQNIAYTTISPTDPPAQVITNLIDEWIRKNNWTWDEITCPELIIRGHAINDTEINLIALFTVADGGSNTSQYMFIFKENDTNIQPANVFKVGMKNYAKINNIKIDKNNVILFGASYKTDNHSDYPGRLIKRDSTWVCKIINNDIQYIDGPKLSWVKTENQPRTPQAEASKTKSMVLQTPILTANERRQAEQPYASQIASASKKYPAEVPWIKAQAHAYFVAARALKKVGFSPGGIDYFNKMVDDEMSRHGGIAFAFDAAFRVAKKSVWSKRGWDEAPAKAKIKVIDQAMEDVHRIWGER